MKVRAIVAAGKGGTDVLVARDIDLAWPRGPGDVLVRLEAASVNPADVFFRQLGGYLASADPFVLGHDGAGIIESVGSGVTGWKRGDRVAFCNGGIGGDPGTYAAAAVVPAAQLARVPDGVGFEEAAALPLVSITAWEALHDRARVRHGEHVLIHAGAGGTGHVAVQLARLAGARVAATVSNAEKASFVEGLGAGRAIDYRAEDFVDAALSWSGGQGIDVALDNIGGAGLVRTYRAMAPYGRIVTLMGIAGDDAETSAYNQNLTIHNLMMLTPMWKGLADRLAAQARIVERVLGLVAARKLRIHVADAIPLADVARAHERMEKGGMTGKLVLRIGG